MKLNPKSIANYPTVLADYVRAGNEDPPELVKKGSSKTVNWLCANGHWRRCQVRYRMQLGDCPKCRGKSILDLPDVAADYMRATNELTSGLLRVTSPAVVNWKCESGHEWSAPVISRVRSKGCRQCRQSLQAAQRKQRLLQREPPTLKRATLGLAVTHPAVAELWSQKNGELSAAKVTHGSGVTAWWECQNGHEWQNRVFEQVRRVRPCVSCQPGYGVGVTVSESHLVQFWDAKKNKVHPSKVGSRDPSAYWWRCERGHSFSRSARAIFRSGLKCRECRVVEWREAWTPIPAP